MIEWSGNLEGWKDEFSNGDGNKLDDLTCSGGEFQRISFRMSFNAGKRQQVKTGSTELFGLAW